MSNISTTLNIWKFYSRFAISFTTIGYGVRRLIWGGNDYDLSNQVWLVTGATGGIGRATVLTALKHGATVIAVARNTEKLKELEKSAEGISDKLVLEKVDLSLQSSVQGLVDKFSTSDNKIDVLVNNVGILYREHSQTSEGHETTYATNLLNQHVLTEGLIKGESLAAKARIINVASGGLYNVPRNTAYLNMASEGYNGVAAYASHKRAQLALTDYCQKKHAHRGLCFYTMHPGWVDTDGVKRALASFRATFKYILRDSFQGADTIIWLGATAPKEVVDKIWFDRKARYAHVFKISRRTATSIEDIAAYLDKDIEAFKKKSNV